MDTCIPIQDSIVYYLQRLDYEVEGLKLLYTHAMRTLLPEENKNEILQKYQEKYAEFQLAKQEFWEPYKSKYLGAYWSLDYASGILRIKEDISCKIGESMCPGSKTPTTECILENQ